uniref:Uncharacterized protein n=1 Tax=Arundo donax TaxID=35708 RepID=A0A0A9GN52_ARUDO
MYLTWPRPCLLRPPLRRLKVMAAVSDLGPDRLGTAVFGRIFRG